MNARDITSPWARVAFVLLSAMWTLAGWYIVFDGKFTTTTKRTTITTTVDGASAFFIGVVFIVLGWLAFLIFLQSVRVSLKAHIVGLTLILVIPWLAFRYAFSL